MVTLAAWHGHRASHLILVRVTHAELTGGCYRTIVHAGAVGWPVGMPVFLISVQLVRREFQETMASN